MSNEKGVQQGAYQGIQQQQGGTNSDITVTITSGIGSGLIPNWPSTSYSATTHNPCPIHTSFQWAKLKGHCTCIDYKMKDSILMSFYLEGA